MAIAKELHHCEERSMSVSSTSLGKHPLDPIQQEFPARKRHRQIKHEEVVDELSFHESLKVVQAMRNAVMLHFNDEMDVVEGCEEQPLSVWEERVMRVSEQRSIFVASILINIDLLCESAFPNPLFAKRSCMQFALKLANTLPLKNAREDKEISTAEREVIRSLGRMLFLLQRTPQDVLAHANIRNVEGAVGFFRDKTVELMGEVTQEIDAHARKNKGIRLQNHQDVFYQKMSVEMAKILMLKEGGLNIGIIDDLQENLIPPEWQNFVSIQTTKKVMDKLIQNPQLWAELDAIKAPEHKNLPSNDLIRITLGKASHEPVTEHDAKVVVLSTLLANVRQDHIGSCFATAWLIRLIVNEMNNCIADFGDAIQHGHLLRFIDGEKRELPLIQRTSNQGLEHIITIDDAGTLLSVVDTTVPKAKRKDVEGVHRLHEVPGFLAVCKTFNLKNPQATFAAILAKTEQRTFRVSEIIEALVEEALEYRRVTRAEADTIKEKLRWQAQYSYVSQTNHPMHRAWEQMSASCEYYFNYKYCMPHWTYESMEHVLKVLTKNANGDYKHMQRLVMKWAMLPMISRMHYRYNPHIENEMHLFGEDSGEQDQFYGYELCDTGLPKDFVNSDKLIRNFKNHTRTFHPERFDQYSPSETWKVIRTPEEFQKFILNIISTTIKYVKNHVPENYSDQQWFDFEGTITDAIASPTFPDQVTTGLFGAHHIRKETAALKKNPFLVDTTPWKFFWGGDPNELIRSYYEVNEMPVKELKFAGNAKETLCWNLRYLKDKPEAMLEDMISKRDSIIICSSGHAFLFNPFDESVVRAIRDPRPPAQYVTECVENPGKEIADRIVFTAEIREQLIDYIASNAWVSSRMERHDSERQQLSATSKHLFDEELPTLGDLTACTLDEIKKKMRDLVGISRAGDPLIGRRVTHWEKTFVNNLTRKIKQWTDEAGDATVTQDLVDRIIDFSRNRRETCVLSPEEAAELRRFAATLPAGISIKDFRKNLLDAGQKIHDKYEGIKSQRWKTNVTPCFDTKFFKLIPEEEQNALLATKLSPYDYNWKDGAHNLLGGYIVNPASGKLELCKIIADTRKIQFMEQGSWFKAKKHYWKLPDSYRIWHNERHSHLRHLIK